MLVFVKDKGALVNFIILANEEDSEWSLEYYAPGFYFKTDDALLEGAVNHYLADLEATK